MSDTSLTEALPDNNHRKHRGWNSPRTIAFTALAIAVIAAAAAIAAWLLPAHRGDSYSSQQSAAAKANVCDAYSTVYRAVFEKYPDPSPTDPVTRLSEATNKHMALLGGGAYLRETVAAQPATPADLATAVNSIANTLQQMGLDYIGKAKKTTTDPLRRDLGSETREVSKICGPKDKK